jgi:mannose-1-phosphate guanylyltransferase
VNGMVFAAGRGERMSPLSLAVPKPALEVLGRPLLASAHAHLRRAGCHPVALNLHHGAARVAAAARACDAAIAFSWEPELLGGAGGLAAARCRLTDGAVLAANADVWAELDLAPLLAAATDDTVTLALLPHPDPQRWSSIVLEPDGRVAAFVRPGAGRRGSPYLFTGFQLVGAKIVAALPPPPSEMAALWERVRGRGALRGVVVAGRWSEVGTPAAYARLIRDLLGPRAWVHPQATVADGARVARSAVGAGCRVGPGAVVEDSVLTAGAVVGEGAEVRGCVAAGSVTVSGPCSDALITPYGRAHLQP